MPKPSRGAPRTALAFLLAPAVPAALAAIAAAGRLGVGGDGVAVVFISAFSALSLGGYLSAFLVGVPIYLMIPRGRAVPPAGALLLGGIVAAAPWTAFGVLSHDAPFLIVAAAAFGLGCIGGLVFTLVRDGRPWRVGP